MCGLAGIVASSRGGRVHEGLLLAMRDVQRHRGPDEAGLYIADGVGLGHRRLSIIDLKHGQQPMLDESAGLALIHNGEIYNFESLKQELELLGARFHSGSDTEVLLQAWRYWGESCLSKLVGMYAFAVWDAKTRRIHLVRDRLGIKPLYYAFTQSGDMVFASELKGVLAHPEVARVLRPESIEDYLAFGYVPDPVSIYQGVFKLPAGYWLSWSAGESAPVPRQYWDVPFRVEATMQLEEATSELRRLLDQAVTSELVSDVPLGAFLSGGLDSSSVVAAMSRAAQGPVNTCAIGFNHGQFDETAFARRVATDLGTRHVERRVDADDYTLVDMLAGIYDEPFADSSALPTFRVCGLARTYATVVLSGDGGDEDFAGYRRYRWHQLESLVRTRLPSAFRKPVFGFLGSVYPKADWAPRPLRAKTTLRALAYDNVEAYFHTVCTVPSALRARLYSAGFKRSLQGYSALSVFQQHSGHAPSDEPLLMAQYLDYKTYLPGDILTKVDRASMAHSLEVRVPFLDHRLVEWASTVPPALKIRNGVGKYVLKKAMEGTLPAEIVYRNKQGFRVPLADWFRGPLRERAHAALLTGAVAQSGFFELSELKKLLSQHASGIRDNSTVLWSMIMLDAFLRRESQPQTSAVRGGSVRTLATGT